MANDANHIDYPVAPLLTLDRTVMSRFWPRQLLLEAPAVDVGSPCQVAEARAVGCIDLRLSCCLLYRLWSEELNGTFCQLPEATWFPRLAKQERNNDTP